MNRRNLAIAAVTSLAVLSVVLPTTPSLAKPPHLASQSTEAFVEPGTRTGPTIDVPLAAPRAAQSDGRSTAPGSPRAAHLAPEDPPPPPTREECLAQDAAQTSPGDLDGWYKDRYGWCAYGEYGAPGTDVNTGQVVANFSAEFIVIGYGNNGARQFDYLVYIEDIETTGAAVNWNLAMFEVSFTGCNASMTCPTTMREATIPSWRAANAFAVTFTSPEVAGAGEQIVRSTIGMRLRFSTPTQPEWVWGSGTTVAESPIRYDSASYVGRARGAVFPAYRLVFSVDLRQSNQDESALHILHAFDRPQHTFPSWLGKSVPGKTEPLTRMYNETDKIANREHSRQKCLEHFGAWNGNLVNCDEYPFASTYEGSKTGPAKYGWGERYSVRLIDRDDNQFVGNELLEVAFYRALRILDGEKFYVSVAQ